MAKKNLLLIDADSKSLRMLEVSLRKAGFSVTTAVNAPDAREKIEMSAPDLILTDTKLPGPDDGLVLVGELKNKPETADIPIVFLSSENNLEQKVRGLELGVEDYLTKPIYLKEVLTRVRVLLEKLEKERLERRERSATFAGVLGEMGLVDLLQTIEIGRKTGHLDIETGTQKGMIAFRDGKVVDARVARLRGERAFYRMLVWNDGSFSMEFGQHDEPDVIELSTQGLLMEGMRRVDEWGRLLEQLPPLERVFEIDYGELIERLAEIPDEVNGILRMFDGNRSLLEVVDDCDFGDLEALEVCSKLFFEGLIYDVANRRHETDEGQRDAPVEAWLAEEDAATQEQIDQLVPAPTPEAPPPAPPPATEGLALAPPIGMPEVEALPPPEQAAPLPPAASGHAFELAPPPGAAPDAVMEAEVSPLPEFDDLADFGDLSTEMSAPGDPAVGDVNDTEVDDDAEMELPELHDLAEEDDWENVIAPEDTSDTAIVTTPPSAGDDLATDLGLTADEVALTVREAEARKAASSSGATTGTPASSAGMEVDLAARIAESLPAGDDHAPVSADSLIKRRENEEEPVVVEDVEHLGRLGEAADRAAASQAQSAATRGGGVSDVDASIQQSHDEDLDPRETTADLLPLAPRYFGFSVREIGAGIALLIIVAGVVALAMNAMSGGETQVAGTTPPSSIGTPPSAPIDDDTKPTDTKPTDTKPTDTKPTDTKPTDTKPTDTKPTDTKPTDTKPTDTKPTDTKPTDTKPTDTKPTDTKPTDTKPTDTKPKATKPKATKPKSSAQLAAASSQDSAAAAANREEKQYARQLRLARKHSRSGRWQKSIHAYKAALAVRPDSSAAHLGLGNAYYELDSIKASLDHLEKARALNSRDPQVFLLLGAVYQTAGRNGDAAAAYDRYLALAPGGKFARDVKAILGNLKP